MTRFKDLIFLLPLAISIASRATSAQQPANNSSIVGTWLGTISQGPLQLRIQFHIISGAAGLVATMDSLDQGARGIPVSAVKLEGGSLHLEVAVAHGQYDGKMDDGGSTITGAWTQGGASIPLLLHRTEAEAAPLRRPQTPQKPYPYREEDVSYPNSTAGVTLAATLTLPQGKGLFPAVLLITGSGPHDRDETIFEHRPFLVLADYLTRKGFAVLRADKRGSGKSTGSYATATTADFATDADAGVAYLQSRPQVNHEKIGLIGHSEGGAVAPLVAARNPKVAFIVLMAGPGLRGDQILLAQRALIAESQSASREDVDKDAAIHRRIYSFIELEKDKDAATIEKETREKFTGQLPEQQLDAEAKALSTPWFRYFLAYDPVPTLRQVKCPVLAIGGSRDLQVPPDEDLAAIRKALEAAGNKHFEVDKLDGLNHLFQSAKTGSPSEYAQIEETISPVVLEKIALWLQKQ